MCEWLHNSKCYKWIELCDCICFNHHLSPLFYSGGYFNSLHTPLVLVPSHRGEWHFGLQQNILTYTKLCFLCKENIYIFVCMQTWHHFTYLENRFLKPVIYFNFINLNLGHEYFTILYNIIHWSTQNISLFNELNIYLFSSSSL